MTEPRPILSSSVIGPLRDDKGTGQGGVKVMQVPPTPKATDRPANLRELLLQLGLGNYEAKFVEQDIDLEVRLYA